MKKLLALLLALLILAAVALCMIGAKVSEEKDRVTVTEQALYGDPAAAAGATVTQTAHLDSHLLWNTVYPVGGKASSEYGFSMRALTFERNISHHGIRLYDHIRYGYDLKKPLEECTGLERAYRELYDATAPGTKGTKTVRLQDLYDYYPIRIDIDLPGTLWHGIDYEDLAEDDFINQRTVWDKFSEFFRIPIPDSLSPIEISVTKSESGQEIGIGSHTAVKDGEHYSLYTNAAYTADACYFTINNRIGDGYVDTSLIPGGYGIYRFRYTDVRDETNTSGTATIFHPGFQTGVDADSLTTVYPLEERVQVQSMEVDPTGTKLLLVTEDGTGLYLLVLNLATMTEQHRFRLSDGGFASLNHQEDFVIAFHGVSFSLFSLDGQGVYTHVLTADQPSATDESFAHINTFAAMDFDGERLIMADVLPESQYRTMETCNFCLAVYDSDGLQYYGEYLSSLATHPDTSHYSYNCIPQKLTVSWDG